MRGTATRSAEKAESRRGIAEHIIEPQLRSAAEFIALHACDGKWHIFARDRQPICGNDDCFQSNRRFLRKRRARKAHTNTSNGWAGKRVHDRRGSM
jgi:hypothetical protein